jgi:protein transport protein SEC24
MLLHELLEKIFLLGCVSKYSGGEVKYYPGYHPIQTPNEVERFENDLRRYLQRKIGFEAVMRLRTPPGSACHSFLDLFNHFNFSSFNSYILWQWFCSLC